MYFSKPVFFFLKSFFPGTVSIGHLVGIHNRIHRPRVILFGSMRFIVLVGPYQGGPQGEKKAEKPL